MPSLFASPAEQIASMRGDVSSGWWNTPAPEPRLTQSYGGSYGGTPGQISYASATETIPGISSLINQINRTAAKSAQDVRIPQGPALEKKSSANIAAQLTGEVPADVMNLLAQEGAERGVAMGSPGSPNASAAYLRALGLTSLQQQQVGEQNLTAALARNPAAPIYDPSQLVLTPYQAAQLQMQQTRSGGGGGYSIAPSRGGGGGSQGPFSYTPDVGGTTQTGTTPSGPSIPFDWQASTFPPGYGSIPMGEPGTGTTGIVPPGSEYDPNLGIYYDPAGNQFYSGDTAQPIDFEGFSLGG